MPLQYETQPFHEYKELVLVNIWVAEPQKDEPATDSKPEAHAVQSVDPDAEAYIPAAQLEQALAPVTAEAVPGEHFKQLELPTLPWNTPTAQEVQIDEIAEFE
jgi:hypothetical protein